MYIACWDAHIPRSLRQGNRPCVFGFRFLIKCARVSAWGAGMPYLFGRVLQYVLVELNKPNTTTTAFFFLYKTAVAACNVSTSSAMRQNRLTRAQL